MDCVCPSVSTENPCPEKPLSPGKTGMAGSCNELPQGLGKLASLTGGEQSSVRERGWPECREKGGNVFMLTYAGVVFPGDSVEVEQHLEEWLSIYVGRGWLVET